MTGREKMTYAEKRVYLYNRAGSRCEECGRNIELHSFEWAHRLPQDEVYMSRYGKKIIHHPLNAAAVCQARSCNDAVSMREHPIEEKKLVERIRRALDAEEAYGAMFL